jgi:ABC-type glycerol-3-phosphate transport system permease component
MQKMTVVLTLISWVILVVYLMPFIWLIGTSFKPIGEWGEPYLIPRNPTLRNYVELTTGAIYGVRGHFPPITSYLINSIITASAVAMLTTLFGSMTAYAIQRYRVGGTTFASWILSLRMIPTVAILLPLVILTRSLGIYNTLTGLIFVYPVIALPIATWFMIGSFKSIPREAEEAALLDGCTELETFYRIVLPQSTTGLATAATFAFLFCWSEFLIPLLLAPSESAMPLTVFAAYFSNQYGILWGPLSAAAIVIAIPVVVIAIVIHKYIVRGLTLGFIR